MKKQAINFSWPAELSNFSTDTSKENFSRGKLRVFYKGETEDHRYFSDEFSEELVKSLPYTPVVSYYDEEKDDFVGHATEQQIYGIVDPCVEPSFVKDEEDEDKVWCECDVVLYTERPDKVGELAQKIVGHKQSLELDPHSVKYVVNYDEKKHLRNIEFTAGRFVGVSVLGKDQRPAFTGSEFFSVDENFENKMQILRDYCENKGDDLTQDGGEEMNLDEFMKLSWGDISIKVGEAIYKEYSNDAYTYIIDMFDDSAIVKFLYYVEGCEKLMRVRYSCAEDGTVTLTGINEVHITYEDIEAPAEQVETDIEQNVSNNVDAGAGEPNAESQDDEDKKDKEGPCGCESQVETSDYSVEPAQVSNVEITPQETEEVSVDNEQTNEENTSSASFTDSEREELENLKKEKKVTLVDSYKESLNEDEYVSFMTLAENSETTFEDLELQLLKAYKRNQEDNSIKPMRAFAFAPVNNAENKDTLDAFVKKYSNR